MTLRTERTVIVGMICATILGITGCLNDGQAATAAAFVLAGTIVSGASVVVGQSLAYRKLKPNG